MCHLKPEIFAVPVTWYTVTASTVKFYDIILLIDECVKTEHRNLDHRLVAPQSGLLLGPGVQTIPRSHLTKGTQVKTEGPSWALRSVCLGTRV
jgi:hypothetical protein